MWRRIGIAVAVIYVAVALAPAIAFSIYFVWTEIFGVSPWRSASKLTAPERAEELAKKGKFEQLVSYQLPTPLRLNPTTKEPDLYAIGVGQTTLDKAVSINPVTMFSSSSRASYYSDPSPATGNFNNVLIYEPKTGAVAKVFDSRLAVWSFQWIQKPKLQALAILASQTDTSGDGKLDSNDRSELFLYALDEKSLRPVTGLDGDPIQIVDIPESDGFLIQALQKDPTGTLDREHLPTVLFKVNLATAVAAPVVGSDMAADLQRTLIAQPPGAQATPVRGD